MLRQCPVTSNLPTRMLEVTFGSACARMRSQEDGNDFCKLECRGDIHPPGLVFITKEDFTAMPSIPRSGKCELCENPAATVKPSTNYGLICSSCKALISQVRNRPAVVRRVMHDIHAEELIVSEAGERQAVGCSQCPHPGQAESLRETLREAEAQISQLHTELNETKKELGWAQELIGRLNGHSLEMGDTIRQLQAGSDLTEELDAANEEATRLRAIVDDLTVQLKTREIHIAGQQPGTMAAAIVQACNEASAFLLSKNASYGNSAAEPVRIFSKADPLEQINVRLDDKLSRMIHGCQYPGDNDEKDLNGYLLLKRAVNIFNGWKAKETGKAA